MKLLLLLGNCYVVDNKKNQIMILIKEEYYKIFKVYENTNLKVRDILLYILF